MLSLCNLSMDHTENTAFNSSSIVVCRSVSADTFLTFLATPFWPLAIISQYILWEEHLQNLNQLITPVALVWKDFGDTCHQMLVLFHEVTNGPHKGSFNYNELLCLGPDSARSDVKLKLRTEVVILYFQVKHFTFS